MFFIYILTNRRNGTLYLGQTDDLIGRVWEHQAGIGSQFTRQHGCTKLVWFESHASRDSAFRRERSMKKWNRNWKAARIQRLNPHWENLSIGITETQIYAPARMFETNTLDDLAGMR
jgi:putative endonuclease